MITHPVIERRRAPWQPTNIAGTALYLPLYNSMLFGDSFISRDACGHLCTVTGAVWTPQGRLFDANDDLIAVTHSESLAVGTGDFSLGIWAKCTANSSDFRSIYWKASTSAQYQGYGMILLQTTGFFRPFIKDTDGVEVLPAGATNFTSASLFSFFSMSVDRDNATGFKTYVNGILHATGDPTTASKTLTNTNTANIGTGRDGVSYDFGGTIGAVWLFPGQVLSAADWLRIFEITKWRYQ